MNLKEKIGEDIKRALKDKDVLRRSVLTMVKAALLNKEKEKRSKLSKNPPAGGPPAGGEKLEELSQLSDEEITEVISSEAKKRKDSIEQYGKANRADLVKQEKDELEILKEYLPEQMGEDEIRKLVKETIEKLGASGPQDTGKIMGVLMPQVKGKADGGLVSKIVQEELTYTEDS